MWPVHRDDQALDHVLELAHIARPRVLGQRLHRLGRHAVMRERLRARTACRNWLHEQRNVFAALAQRRHDDVDDVEAVEQILAERALRDHVAQVAVRRGDHAHVDDPAAAVGADLLQLAGLEEPQQEALHAQRHLPDFVEEDGAHVRGFELARLVAIGAGEAALHVAEQLGLEQRFRQAGAVDRREDVVRPRAARVDVARDDFLADAALAGDQDLGVRSRDAVDFLLQRRRSRRCARSVGRACAGANRAESGSHVCLCCFPPHHQSLFMNRSMSRRCSSVMPTNVAPMR